MPVALMIVAVPVAQSSTMITAPTRSLYPGDQGHTVVEEDAKVTLLKSERPGAERGPTSITGRQISRTGWKSAATASRNRSTPQYIAPTSVHDSGQDPQHRRPAVHAATAGVTYVYLAYAFFREMPEGVPGSFRIMANLLSAGKNPSLGK